MRGVTEMKKRLTALLAILVLSLTFTGCNVLKQLKTVDHGTTVETPTPAETNKKDTVTDTPAATEAPTDAPDAEPTEAPDDVIPPDICFLTKDFDGNGWDETCFFENKVTMINLWAYWCGPCVSEMPDLERISKDYADKGLQVIGISMKDEEAENRETLKELGITYPNLFYTEDFDVYMDTGYYPTTIFVDSEGHVLGNACIGSREYGDWAKIIDDILKD